LSARAWQKLERLPKYELLTEPRTKPERVKERIVREKGFTNIVLVGEDVTDMTYQPAACQQAYRLVIVRKKPERAAGRAGLLDDVRYFFYLTKPLDLTVAEWWVWPTVGVTKRTWWGSSSMGSMRCGCRWTIW